MSERETRDVGPVRAPTSQEPELTDELQGGARTPAPERERDNEEPSEPLHGASESETFRARWREIQARFVDEPQRSVEEADGLVAEVMDRLQRTFTDERTRLERLWGGGEEVSTEDLRLTLTRYRSFFNRLLST